jgi:stringent starvation protein B
MAEVSTKPYFIRAIYEWCSDCGYTPYLSVRVDERTRVPMEYVKNGEIVLNVSLNATRNLTVNNELIQFSARFNGVSREVSIPVDRVQGIFARENGQGAFFTVEAPAALAAAPALPVPASAAEADSEPPKPTGTNGNGKTRLKLVK